MWIKSFTAKGCVLAGLTLNRGTEMVYVYSRTNEILVRIAGRTTTGLVADQGLERCSYKVVTVVEGGGGGGGSSVVRIARLNC